MDNNETAQLIIRMSRQLEILRGFVERIAHPGVPLDDVTRLMARDKLNECKRIAEGTA